MSGKEQELIDKGYDRDLVYKLCDFSNEELEDCINIAVDILTENVSVVENPKCIYIGGQPGVGKSVLSDKLKKSSNSVELSMDACRSFHPRYKEIEDTIKNFYEGKELGEDVHPGHDIALFTQYFAGNMANELIDRISDMNYNIILEWNMRNSKDVLSCMNKLSKKGYENEALVLTVHEDISYEASQIRADVMESEGNISRRVNKNFHRLCLDTIPTNVDIIHSVGINNNILNNMKVILRNGKTVWDSDFNNTFPSSVIKDYYTNIELSNGFNNNPIYAKTALEKEMVGLNSKLNRINLGM